MTPLEPETNPGSQRRLMIALLVSFAVFMAWDYFLLKPRRDAMLEKQRIEMAAAANPAAAPAASTDMAFPLVPVAPVAATPKTRVEAIAAEPRLTIRSDAVQGSVRLKGARIDDLVLSQYFVGVDRAQNIELLSPSGAEKPYYIEFGWINAAGQRLLAEDAPFQVESGDRLAPGAPVTLVHEDGAGRLFRVKLEIDEKYLLTVAQTIENKSAQPIAARAYGLISRHASKRVMRTGLSKLMSGEDPGFALPHGDGTSSYDVAHEGFVGVLDGSLKYAAYESLLDKDNLSLPTTQELEATTGWVGITDKYWLTALLLDGKVGAKPRFAHQQTGPVDRYQADITLAAETVAPGASLTHQFRVIAGPKELRTLQAYSAALNVPNLEDAIDFGWYWFMTKPLTMLLNWLGSHLGHYGYGLAILIMTVLVKIAVFPLAQKSYRSMNKLRVLAPKMKEIQERNADDKLRAQQEIMEMYKREKVSPMGGCLPMLLQIPVFFSLFKVLSISIEMRQQPFYGWIHDLSLADPTSWSNLFGLAPWGHLGFLDIGLWPILMGVTIMIQQKLQPPAPDPMQQKIMSFFPVIFTVMLASAPAGLMIYWTWSNLLGILQQRYLTRDARAEAKAKKAESPKAA